MSKSLVTSAALLPKMVCGKVGVLAKEPFEDVDGLGGLEVVLVLGHAVLCS